MLQWSKGMSCSPEQLFTLMLTSPYMNPPSLVKALSWIHGILLCLFGHKIRNISWNPRSLRTNGWVFCSLSMLFLYPNSNLSVDNCVDITTLHNTSFSSLLYPVLYIIEFHLTIIWWNNSWKLVFMIRTLLCNATYLCTYLHRIDCRTIRFGYLPEFCLMAISKQE
jgi:hypothetical protein